MRKENIKREIETDIMGFSTESQLNKLERIRKQYNDSIDEIKENILSGLHFCPECNKYYDEKDFKTKVLIEDSKETIYTDCGYGDDDTWGIVEYINTYRICPKNEKHRQILKHEFVKIKEEYIKDGTKIK